MPSIIDPVFREYLAARRKAQAATSAFRSQRNRRSGKAYIEGIRELRIAVDRLAEVTASLARGLARAQSAAYIEVHSLPPE